jgi:cathepsin L
VPVKDQGKCGSCWAFSTTGALEGIYKITNKKLVSFSEQELVDCAGHLYGNNGCDGGLMAYGFNYIIKNGLETETNYPYVSGKTEIANKCTKNNSLTEPQTNISSCINVEPNELDLLKAVSMQPVSVAIEADSKVFQLYKSGILTDIKCGTNLDHGVLVVGYGHDSELNLDYWKIKNSWGTEWGENGYIRILRTTSNTSVGLCGVAMSGTYPIYN